jgi:hypothetical protein
VNKAKFDIVPICMMRQDIQTAQELGQAIARVCEKKKVTVIASSDLTHYEPQKQAEKKDTEAIKAIEQLNPFAFNQAITKTPSSICGPGPIITAMSYARRMGAQAGHLLKYATSGDVTGEKTKIVGYASLLFE